MTKNRFLFILLFLLIVPGWQSVAQKTRNPEEVVRKYCALDSQGARLSSDGFRRIADLYDWSAEPGWDRVSIIRGFAVKSSHTSGQDAIVSLEYVEAGSLGSETLSLLERTETVELRLTQKRGKWLIVSPVLCPHVSPEALERHIEGLIRDEGEGSRPKWAKALGELKALEAKTPQ